MSYSIYIIATRVSWKVLGGKDSNRSRRPNLPLPTWTAFLVSNLMVGGHQTYAGIKNMLTLLFSHLRSIELIIIVVPQSTRKASERNKEEARKCHQERELSLDRLSKKTVL
ncbi:Uu.00g129150.m01.CDS01 [Anthostomella pinea]|uniref:Uu.00g129150.m01.CDS01 n=1 Tax=Anthostomella pinea TaxID=933095 RepID=A0AAI8YI27_9PEZI|nr:Uu.00g129150.m01.CDS01 [Anthostomella pinea]